MTALADEVYVPPTQANVLTIPAQQVGVTNGLLLEFPQIYAVGDLKLIEANDFL